MALLAKYLGFLILFKSIEIFIVGLLYDEEPRDLLIIYNCFNLDGSTLKVSPGVGLNILKWLFGKEDIFSGSIVEYLLELLRLDEEGVSFLLSLLIVDEANVLRLNFNSCYFIAL